MKGRAGRRQVCVYVAIVTKGEDADGPFDAGDEFFVFDPGLACGFVMPCGLRITAVSMNEDETLSCRQP